MSCHTAGNSAAVSVMAARSDFTANSSAGGEQAIIGPVLPPDILASKKFADWEQTSSDSDAEDLQCASSAESGPVAPSAEEAVQFSYGPALPPGYKKPDDDDDAERATIGPALPPGMDLDSGSVQTGGHSSDEDDIVGPMLPCAELEGGGGEASTSSVSVDIERRALKMKRKLANQGEPEELKREEWMTELPEELKKQFGLGPRSFQRRTPVPVGDRSVWTETPADRMKKEMDGQVPDKAASKSDADSLVKAAQQKYDGDMVKRIEGYDKSSRSESLLDLHKKKLKRKAKEEGGSKPQERRAFDRDIDLKVNAMDNAKRHALIKKSSQLNDKFKCGRSQFL